ncbi:MAG: alpha/beta hydrolase [Deltaproteobacteria bacterium]|nr:alpha/beta hydrolase [Deltaproteobacteria bacterium]
MRQTLKPLVFTALLAAVSCAAVQEMPDSRTESLPGRESPPGLYCEVQGAGPPIILLHGFGGNTYTWRCLAPALSSRYRLLLFDLKGFGASPKPRDGRYSLLDQAELIYQFILKNDLRQVILAGHSMGGGVALQTALKLRETRPGWLSRLILIDSVSYPQKLPGFVAVLRKPILSSLTLYLVPDTLKVRKILELAYFDETKITDADVAAYAAPLAEDGAKYALRQTARQILPEDMEELVSQYPRIEVPTLIIWGRQDEIIPVEHGQRLHRDLKNSRLVIIEECGHNPHEEKPGEVIAAVKDFLEGNP